MRPSRKFDIAYAVCAAALLAVPPSASAHGAAHGSAVTLHAIAPAASIKPAVQATAVPPAAGCSNAAACSLEAEMSAQSSTASSLTSAPALPPQPYDAAAPTAPPVVTAPSPAIVAPDVAVDSSSGGTSRTTDPGAAGLTLADCMTVWEPALHMSKGEWRATCIRTLNGVELPPDGKVAHADGVPADAKHAVNKTAAQQ